MGKRRNLPLRILGIILGTLLGLALLVLVAFQVCTHTSVLDKIAQKVLSGQVDGEVSFSDVRLSRVLDYPIVSLAIDDLLITYPHERYDSLASELDEGRGEISDTLVSIRKFFLRGDLKAFLDRHDISASKFSLEQPRAFLHKYPDGQANWYAIKMLVPSGDTSSFHLGDIRVDDLSISTPRVVFDNAVSDFAMTLDWEMLLARLGFAAGEKGKDLDARISVKDLVAGDLLATLGRSLNSELGKITTDARISMDAESVGEFIPGSWPQFPPAAVSLSIPDSRVSWAGKFKDGRLRLAAEAENTENNVKNVNVSDLNLHVDGVDLGGTAGVDNLLGRDPVFALDATGRAALHKLRSYLPAKVQRTFHASGTVDLDLDGRVKASQLNLEKIADANLSGHIRGLGDVAVAIPKSGIDCFLRRPVINLATMDSAVKDKDRALACTVTADSLDFDLGESVCAKGKNVLLFAQNSSKAISDSTMWHPLLGKATADRLLLRTSDSLVVGLFGTDNKFTVVERELQGVSTPYLRLESGNKGVFVKNSSMMVALRDAAMVSSAQVNAPDSLSRRRRARRSGSDTVFVMPSYLSEREFRKSDIRLSAGESIRNLLTKWNPSLDLSASRGLFATPAFPLRTRFSELSLSLKDDSIRVDSVHVVSGTSDLGARLKLDGLKRSLTRGRGFLRLDGALTSGRLNLNEILTAFEQGKGNNAPESDEGDDLGKIDADAYDRAVAVDSIDVTEPPRNYSLIVVPANLIANLSVDAARVDYSKLVFNDFHSEAAMKERCLSLNETRAVTDMGQFSLNAFYSTRTKQDLAVGFGVNLEDVTAEDVIELFPKVGEVVPMLTSFKGRLNCEMAATSQIDTNMNFLLPTIDGMFKINGQNMVLEDLGSLKKIAKTLMFRDQVSGRIDDMTVNGVVSNNSLEVFPFILSIDRYTVALQGVQSLNKSFDYHVSLIKSPILLKLGVNIFGPSFDDWQFRIGRPRYTSTKIPLFNEEVDNMQINLLTSIKEVFSRGVDRVMQESKDAQAAIAEKKKAVAYGTSTDILTPEEQYKLDTMIIEREIEEESEALAAEIDEIIAGML